MRLAPHALRPTSESGKSLVGPRSRPECEEDDFVTFDSIKSAVSVHSECP